MAKSNKYGRTSGKEPAPLGAETVPFAGRYIKACRELGLPQTKRGWSKFQSGKGAPYKHLNGGGK